MPDFLDDFDRTDATAIGNGWTNGPSANYFIANPGGTDGTAYDLSGGSGRWCYRTGVADADIQVTAQTRGTGGIWLRGSGTNNGLAARWDSNSFKFMKWESGSYTGDIATTGTTLTVTDGDVIRVVAVGTSLQMYQNGTLRLSATSSLFQTNTLVGMYAEGGATRFDDYQWSVVASMALDRANVLTGSGTVAVAAVGSGTAFDGTTVFTLTSAPTGWSIDSQSVTDATHATITLAKGSGTGTFTVSETVTGTTSDTLTATNTATAVADGDWAVAATWDVLEVPAATNNATAPATFDVFVTDTRSIAVLTVSGGSATVQNGGNLTLKDNAVIANGVLQVGETAGPGTLNIDGGKHVTFGSAANQTSGKLVTRSSSASNPSTIRTTAGTTGSGNAYFDDGGFLDSQLYDLEDCQFLDVGDSTTPTPALEWQINTAARTHLFSRLVFNSTCGDVKCNSTLPANVGLSFLNVTHKNQNASGLYVSGDVTANAGVTRVVDGCVFYGQPRLPDKNPVIDACVFQKAFSTGSTAGRFSSLNRSLVRCTTNSSLSRKGDWDYCYLVGDGNTYDGNGRYSAYGDIGNWHAVTPDQAPAGEYVVAHTIVEGWGVKNDLGTVGQPDEFAPTGDIDYSPTATNTSYWHHCLGVPYDLDTTLIADGLPGMAGCLATVLNGTGSKYDHNTWYNGHQGLIALAESSTGSTGMVGSLKSNLVWNSTARRDTSAFNTFAYSTNPSYVADPSLEPDDMIGNGAADYNGRFNLNDNKNFAGAPAYMYKRGSGSAVPGAHDIEADPQFADPAFRFYRWVRALTGTTIPAPAAGGSPLTPDIATANGRKAYCAWGLYKLSLANEPGHADYDSRFTLDAFYAAAAAAFAPQNTVYQNAGHDGQTVGAFPFTALPCNTFLLVG